MLYLGGGGMDTILGFDSCMLNTNRKREPVCHMTFSTAIN
jgi:hypothetical protein